VEVGTNPVVGTDTEKILAAFKKVISGYHTDTRIPPLWDGHAAERIVKTLLDKL
jgi:UDP-N-acetylglucosamine 2-epimerase (non-hydrolysing)